MIGKQEAVKGNVVAARTDPLQRADKLHVCRQHPLAASFALCFANSV